MPTHDDIERAGTGSQLRASMEQKYQDLAPGMMEAALSRGAPGTIEGHVLRWKAFEKWALTNNHHIYPPQTNMVALYLRARKEAKCGASVPDAVKTTVRWVCKKLEMTEPDLNAEEILGIRDQVREEAGKELKEAKAVPERIIVAMGSHGVLERMQCTPRLCLVPAVHDICIFAV